MRWIALFAALAALLVGPARAQPSAPAPRVALLIGLDRYTDPSLPELGTANVDRDLALLKASFERSGFTTRVIKNPTAAALREDLRGFDKVARTAEAAMVYYTGMGVQVDGIDHVSGSDAKMSATRPDDLEAAGFLSIKDLAVAVQSAKFSMVFAEAGRSDPWGAAPSRGFRLGPKITAVEAASDANVLIFYGSQAGTGSADGPAGGNGPFAAAVARHLAEPGVEVGLFIRRVRAQVSRETRGDQRPELYGELGESEFYFAGRGAQPTPQAPRSAPVFSNQPRLALVIGNSDYNRDGDLDDGYDSAAVREQGFPTDLINPANDSADVAAALGTMNFDVTLARDLDSIALADALFKFEQKINEARHDAIVVVYYAGHAIQVGGGNYLLPVGAKLPNADLERLPPAQAELLISQVALPVQTALLGRLSTPDGEGLNLLILDACRENPWGDLVITRSAGARAGGAGRGRYRGLGDVQIDLRRTAIAFATKPGDVAADGGGRNSPYTAALVRHVATPGISVLEMLNRVHGEVETTTQGRQVPWTNGPAMGRTCLGACAVE